MHKIFNQNHICLHNSIYLECLLLIIIHHIYQPKNLPHPYIILCEKTHIGSFIVWKNIKIYFMYT